VRLKLEKKAIRTLGIAESFKRGVFEKSLLCGVVMRSDLIVDGVGVSFATVGGEDATDAILELFRSFKRNDINFLMIGGSVISFFNILDVDRLHEETKLPVISITFRPSEGLERHLKHHFPCDERKIEAYKRLGARDEVVLQTGYRIYVRTSGITVEEARKALDKFTLQGAIPEPIRLAKLMARALLRSSKLGG